MKLHRLVLKNYRGIEHREIDFPDHGVVVISGANEIGKSSMVEALDLLLESKDRSTKKEVKQVKPTHADVGSEVTAEISTGPYRFVYHKRFHKKCETQLTVLEPRREQHSGDEAHDRVQAMLAETVDTELWRAQRVLQSASTDAVNLSGCDALTRHSTSRRAMRLRCREPSRCSSTGSTPSTPATSPRPAAPPASGRRPSKRWRLPMPKSPVRGGRRRGRRSCAAARHADR